MTTPAPIKCCNTCKHYVEMRTRDSRYLCRCPEANADNAPWLVHPDDYEAVSCHRARITPGLCGMAGRFHVERAAP